MPDFASRNMGGQRRTEGLGMIGPFSFVSFGPLKYGGLFLGVFTLS